MPYMYICKAIRSADDVPVDEGLRIERGQRLATPECIYDAPPGDSEVSTTNELS